MMLTAAALALAQALSPAAMAFIDESTDILIAGDDLDPGFTVRLQVLPADQRMLVIVHLRRAGLLGKHVIPVEWITAPAHPAAMEEGR